MPKLKLYDLLEVQSRIVVPRGEEEKGGGVIDESQIIRTKIYLNRRNKF
jgi:hypothetical protein